MSISISTSFRGLNPGPPFNKRKERMRWEREGEGAKKRRKGGSKRRTGFPVNEFLKTALGVGVRRGEMERFVRREVDKRTFFPKFIKC